MSQKNVEFVRKRSGCVSGRAARSTTGLGVPFPLLFDAYARLIGRLPP
jgi:hypothetical protein